MGTVDLLGHWNHWIVVVLMMTGFYVIMARGNLVKKLLGLNVLQAAVILLYVTMGRVDGGTAAILVDLPEHGAAHDGEEVTAHAEAADPVIYSNPVPHVLMLTAIVVGVATTAVGLALVVRIQEAYGTIEEDEILALEEGEA